MKKLYEKRDGQKIVKIDITKDFNRFVKNNEKLLKELSRY